ncbi:alcohol dehydrogenase catalytic domain-containing protein [Streptomyces sp. NPDC002769]|uniref:alcohol dehydrogenase catalytic domain-containing protein n=1 Tax=Streptomyces sp. NPDC002769 TaxID=3154542 RepID=UPI00332F6B5D
MRSIVHDRFGEPSEVLPVTEVPDPTAPGPGEVLIRVTTRPVHPGDLAGIRGRHTTDHHLPAPVTPGMEGVGMVEALGDGIGVDSGLTVGRNQFRCQVPGRLRRPAQRRHRIAPLVFVGVDRF